MPSRVTVEIKDDRVVIQLPGSATVLKLSDKLARELGEALFKAGWNLLQQRQNENNKS